MYASSYSCSYSFNTLRTILTENDILQNPPLPTLLHQPPKHPALDPHQLPRRPELNRPSRVHDQDAVEVHDRAQPVRNDQQRRGVAAELGADGALNQRVRGHVDGRGGLVQDHDLGAGDDGAGEAEELPLALGEVEAAFGDGGGEGGEDVAVAILCRACGG